MVRPWGGDGSDGDGGEGVTVVEGCGWGGWWGLGLAGELHTSLRVLLVLSLLEHDGLELPCSTQRPPPQGCCPVLPDVQLEA